MRTALPLALFAGFLFLILPFVYFEITQDPELTPRFLALSAFLALFTIFIWSLRKYSNLEIEADPISISFALYFIISLLAITRSINTGDAVYELGKYGLWILVLFLFPSIFKRTPNHKSIITAIITVSCLVFLSAGIYQLFDLLQGESVSKNSSHIVSFLSNKNFFGETLLLSIPFIIYSIFSNLSKFRWISLIAFILCLYFIFFIQSVTVFIGAFLSFLTMLILTVVFRKKLFKNNYTLKQAFFISICVITIFFVPITLLMRGNIGSQGVTSKIEAVKFYIQNPKKIYSSATGQNDNSVYDRVFLAKNSLKLFQEHPISGIGLANWKIMMPKFGMYGTNIMSVGRIRFEHPHSDYLFILCETGIAGMIFWILMFGFGFFFAMSSLVKSSDRDKSLLMVCLIGVLVAFSTISLFSYPKERVFSMMLLITALSLIRVNIPESIKKIKIPSTHFLLVTFMFSICVFYINFQRYRSEVSLYTAFQFQKNGRFNQMQQSMESAISPFQTLDLTGTPLRWHLGQAFYYQGNHQQAFENYLIASKQNPYHMQVLNDLGALYESQGDHINATNCFDRVFAINPNFADSKFNMAAVYFNSGDTTRAYLLLKKINARYSSQWQTAMQTILLAKTEKLVQSTGDTVLVDLVNNKLKYDPKYLLLQFFEADKEGIAFEDKLISNKPLK